MTIVATTHYMEEAREYCDHGASDEPRPRRNLWTARPPHTGVRAGGPESYCPEPGLGSVRAKDLEALPAVIHLRKTQSDFYLYGDNDVLDEVTAFLRREGVSAGVMQTRPANLDDIYFLAVGGNGPQGAEA